MKSRDHPPDVFIRPRDDPEARFWSAGLDESAHLVLERPGHRHDPVRMRADERDRFTRLEHRDEIPVEARRARQPIGRAKLFEGQAHDAHVEIGHSVGDHRHALVERSFAAPDHRDRPLAQVEQPGTFGDQRAEPDGVEASGFRRAYSLIDQTHDLLESGRRGVFARAHDETAASREGSHDARRLELGIRTRDRVGSDACRAGERANRWQRHTVGEVTGDHGHLHVRPKLLD